MDSFFFFLLFFLQRTNYNFYCFRLTTHIQVQNWRERKTVRGHKHFLELLYSNHSVSKLMRTSKVDTTHNDRNFSKNNPALNVIEIQLLMPTADVRASLTDDDCFFFLIIIIAFYPFYIALFSTLEQTHRACM